jgi:hypothetical protein
MINKKTNLKLKLHLLKLIIIIINGCIWLNICLEKSYHSNINVFFSPCKCVFERMVMFNF